MRSSCIRGLGNRGLPGAAQRTHLIVLAFLLTIAALLAVAACGDPDSTDVSRPPSNPTTTLAADTPTPQAEPTAPTATPEPAAAQHTITSVPSVEAKLEVSSPLEFVAVSAGFRHTCGVRPDRTVTCWGSNHFGKAATPPAGEFTSISAGAYHNCGVKPNGTVACWGLVGQADVGGVRQVNGPFLGAGGISDGDALPEGEFVAVSAGAEHACGLRPEGTVTCWSTDYRRQDTRQGEFVAISAGVGHTCGLRPDGTVACWGSDSQGEATPPPGEFASISAGHSHTCGVRMDGSVTCWGNNGEGQATPPEGEFASVSAGSIHNCGLRMDGTVACWGNNDNGEATPPPGEFVSVSAGGAHTCGVRPDGTVACWGNNDDGEATPPGELEAYCKELVDAFGEEPETWGKSARSLARGLDRLEDIGPPPGLDGHYAALVEFIEDVHTLLLSKDADKPFDETDEQYQERFSELLEKYQTDAYSGLDDGDIAHLQALGC